MRTVSLAAGLTLVVPLLAAPLHAQTTTASLSGRVLDSSGAVLPGASVTITNPATGVTVWSGVADRQGLYVALSLPVGTYDVAASLAGFKPVSVKGVQLTGETSGQLESQSSSMGLVVETAQVQNLPLASRAILNLLSLVGGVSAGGPSTGLNSAQLSINGSRTLNSEFTRHEKLNANDFFRKLRGDPRPTDRYSQFGAKIVGPLRIPGLYDGHERTFFFVNYEGLRRKQPSTALLRVHGAGARALRQGHRIVIDDGALAAAAAVVVVVTKRRP
jgi:hypothetical protein